jgi:hypothetical protein
MLSTLGADDVGRPLFDGFHRCFEMANARQKKKAPRTKKMTVMASPSDIKVSPLADEDVSEVGVGDDYPPTVVGVDTRSTSGASWEPIEGNEGVIHLVGEVGVSSLPGRIIHRAQARLGGISASRGR